MAFHGPVLHRRRPRHFPGMPPLPPLLADHTQPGRVYQGIHPDLRPVHLQRPHRLGPDGHLPPDLIRATPALKTQDQIAVPRITGRVLRCHNAVANGVYFPSRLRPAGEDVLGFPLGRGVDHRGECASALRRVEIT